MRAVPLGFALCASCVAGGREGVVLPVVLAADATGPFAVDGVVIRLTRARLTTADLVLYDDALRPMGAWAGTRPADMLGLPGPHGNALLYEGRATRASFRLVGDRAVSLAGTVEGDIVWSFDVDLVADRRVDQASADLTVDADEPPAGVRWTLDLARALDAVPWSEGPLEQDAAFTDAVLDGFTRDAAWSVGPGR